MEDSLFVRGLHNDSTELFGTVVVEELIVLSNDYFYVEESCFGLHHCDGGFEDQLVNKDFVSSAFVNVVGHVEGFTACTGFVEERSIAETKLSDFLHHGLIVDLRLKSPLRDLGLVGSI